MLEILFYVYLGGVFLFGLYFTFRHGPIGGGFAGLTWPLWIWLMPFAFIYFMRKGR